MLDAALTDLREALIETQEALRQLRRDDGKLINGSVGVSQLDRQFAEQLADYLRLTPSGKSVLQLVDEANSAAVTSQAAEQSIALLAQDAERAATVANEALAEMHRLRDQLGRQYGVVAKNVDVISAYSTEAEDWANYSHAQADNAIKAKDEALAWAEYLAGPVVNSDDAPAYISGSAWPHGLYYQPVEGYGGTGGLWSAKWWAIYAQTIVGPWAFYYFGPWPAPPSPGMRNSDTGQVVPTPIGEGSMYYDTTAGMLFVWDGTQWVAAFEAVLGYKSEYTYVATANQSVFSGPDVNGQTPVVGDARSAVHLNGVLLVEGSSYDYTINTSTNTLTLAMGAPAGSIVQWALVPQALAPMPVKAFGVTLTPSAPDGATTAFTMAYSGGAVNALDAHALLVSLDGIVQQPGIDYNAAGATLTFPAAPRADSRLWVTWWSPT